MLRRRWAGRGSRIRRLGADPRNWCAGPDVIRPEVLLRTVIALSGGSAALPGCAYWRRGARRRRRRGARFWRISTLETPMFRRADASAVCCSSDDERPELIITDSMGWLLSITPEKRRLRMCVIYPGLFFGALGGFFTRHLYFNHFMDMDPIFF